MVAELEMTVVDCLASHLVLGTAAVAAAAVAAVVAEMELLPAVLHSGTQSAADILPMRVTTISITALCELFV
jgi:hypothetical protein